MYDRGTTPNQWEAEARVRSYRPLPTHGQLRHYYCVYQDVDGIPCAMFVLERDATDWVNQQQCKELYHIEKKAK